MNEDVRRSEVAVVLGNLVLENQVIPKRVPGQLCHQTVVLMKIHPVVRQDEVWSDLAFQPLEKVLDIGAAVRQEAVSEALDDDPMLACAAKERLAAPTCLLRTFLLGAQDHPGDDALREGLDQLQDRPAATDLDVVRVSPEGQDLERAPSIPAQRYAQHLERRLSARSTSRLPDLPGRATALEQRFEVVLVLQGIHGGPEPFVAVGDEQLALDEPYERLGDEVLAVADVIEDVASEDEEPSVDPDDGRADVLDSRYDSVSQSHCVEGVARRSHAQERRGLVVVDVARDDIGQRSVCDGVAVRREEMALVVQMVTNRSQPFADLAVEARVDEGDAPLADVAAQEFDVAPSVGQDEIVGMRLVVVEKELFDHLRLVTEAENEILVSMVSVVLHDVPEDRTTSDRHHGLRDARRGLGHAETRSTAEDDDLHGSELPCSRMDDHLWNRDDEPCTPIADEGELLDDLVLEVPRKDEDVVRSALRDLARVHYRYVRTGQEPALLVRVPVDGVVHEIGSNTTVVQKGVSLPGRSIAGD